MPNTYTQLYIHLVFAVKYRDKLILPSFKERLQQYITAIIQNKGNKLLAINFLSEHGHIFYGQNPDISISDLVKDVKVSSTNLINDNKLIVGKFNWQTGYGAFSYSHSQIDKVVKYILNQEKHHKIKTFKEEYIETLKAFNVQFNEKYLFDFFETGNGS